MYVRTIVKVLDLQIIDLVFVGLKLYILCLAIFYMHIEPYEYVHQLDTFRCMKELDQLYPYN